MAGDTYLHLPWIFLFSHFACFIRACTCLIPLHAHFVFSRALSVGGVPASAEMGRAKADSGHVHLVQFLSTLQVNHVRIRVKITAATTASLTLLTGGYCI